LPFGAAVHIFLTDELTCKAACSDTSIGYAVGGLVGESRFLLLIPETLNLTSDPGAFQFVTYSTSNITARYAWSPRRFSDNVAWPPKGVHLAAEFTPPTVRARVIPAIGSLALPSTGTAGELPDLGWLGAAVWQQWLPHRQLHVQQ
jgi:hypothetical protein